MIKARHLATWEERLDEMKMTLLKEQRVIDPALLCCDYSEAEARIAQGLPGNRKYGGAVSVRPVLVMSTRTRVYRLSTMTRSIMMEFNSVQRPCLPIMIMQRMNHDGAYKRMREGG